MRKSGQRREAHAKFCHEEKGFICLVCKKTNVKKKRAYFAWEIPIHLLNEHNIDRKQQCIKGWTTTLEEMYRKGKSYASLLDYSSEEEKEKEKLRRQKELKTQRDSW